MIVISVNYVLNKLIDISYNKKRYSTISTAPLAKREFGKAYARPE